jgi:hypothetical protein
MEKYNSLRSETNGSEANASNLSTIIIQLFALHKRLTGINIYCLGFKRTKNKLHVSYKYIDLRNP